MYKNKYSQFVVHTQTFSPADLQIVPLKEVVEYNLGYTWRHSESTFVGPLEERGSMKKFSRIVLLVY